MACHSSAPIEYPVAVANADSIFEHRSLGYLPDLAIRPLALVLIICKYWARFTPWPLAPRGVRLISFLANHLSLSLDTAYVRRLIVRFQYYLLLNLTASS